MDDNIPSTANTGHCLCELACMDAGAAVGCMAMADYRGGHRLVSDAVSQPFAHHRQDADVVGTMGVRHRQLEYFHPALSVYDIPGARPRALDSFGAEGMAGAQLLHHDGYQHRHVCCFPLW